MSERPSPEKEALKPFATTYSPQLPELLQRAGCSLALSTY